MYTVLPRTALLEGVLTGDNRWNVSQYASVVVVLRTALLEGVLTGDNRWEAVQICECFQNVM